MANEAPINLLDWCKRERENLQCQFDALKAGRFKTHSNDGSGWKDTTQDSIERVEENIRVNMRQHGLSVKVIHVVRCPAMRLMLLPPLRLPGLSDAHNITNVPNSIVSP